MAADNTSHIPPTRATVHNGCPSFLAIKKKENFGIT